MIAQPYKAKNYAWFALKVGILLISFYYLYLKLSDQYIYWLPWRSKLIQPKFVGIVLGFFGMSVVNWLLEAKKWQLLVTTYKSLSFAQALSQTLAALTVSLPTPSRLGEYAAKAYYYPFKERKRIVFLNGLGNGAQMGITCGFGILGLLAYGHQLPVQIDGRWLAGCIGAGTVLLLVFFYRGMKLSFFKVLDFNVLLYHFKKIPSRTLYRIIALSAIRYLFFSTQFYLIMLLLGAEITPLESLPIIYIMYLVVSILPMFPFLDIVVKGSTAVWLFQTIGVNEYTVLAATLGVWTLNLVIPSIFGSFQLIKAPN